MADAVLVLSPALPVLARPTRHGREDDAPGVIVAERTGFAMAMLQVRRGRDEALAAAVRAAFALDLPPVGRRISAAELCTTSIGPGQWLVEMPASATAAQGIELVLAAKLGDVASITDQSHARVILRLRGLRVRDVLATGVPLDLHPRAFAPGSAAQTLLAHIAVAIWQLDDAPTYELSVPRSLIGDARHWLETAAARYGLAVEAPLTS